MYLCVVYICVQYVCVCVLFAVHVCGMCMWICGLYECLEVSEYPGKKPHLLVSHGESKHVDFKNGKKTQVGPREPKEEYVVTG